MVIAAGPWSERLAACPARGRPLRPVKGQILRLHDPAGPGLLTRVVRMGAAYVVPRGDGRYVHRRRPSRSAALTPRSPPGRSSSCCATPPSSCPGVSEFVLDEFAAGLRPGSADNLPVIGPGALPGLHWATGHGRGGILLAPVTAELVCAGLAAG